MRRGAGDTPVCGAAVRVYLVAPPPTRMLLLLDSYDSFTWNLYQAFAALGEDVRVVRNDALSAAELVRLAPRAVCLGPGPGRPGEAGVCPDLLAALPDDVPVLGVCLGHQALVEHHGGALELDPVPTHGRATLVHHDGRPPFAELPNPFPAGRYHSLRARAEDLPAELELAAWTAEGLIMGVRERRRPRFGVQFHPESILTPEGPRLLAGFLASGPVPVHPIESRA